MLCRHCAVDALAVVTVVPGGNNGADQFSLARAQGPGGMKQDVSKGIQRAGRLGTVGLKRAHSRQFFTESNVGHERQNIGPARGGLYSEPIIASLMSTP